MNNQHKKQIRALELPQLVATIEELRRDLFALRLRAATSHAKSFSSDRKKLKKSIACALTIAHEKRAHIGK